MRPSLRNVHRVVAASFAALALLLPAAVGAQDIVRGSDGTISVRASEVPLERLLQALTEITPFDKIVVKGTVGERLVTLTLENVTPMRAIVQALNIAGVDFVLGGGRLVLGDSTFDGARESAASDQALPVAATWAADANLPKTRDDDDTSGARAAEDRPSAADAAREAAETQIRAAELEHALAAPALPTPVGAPIELPFPGPDGRTPITTIKPAGAVQALPFPGVPAAIPAVPAAQPTDPRVQQLIDALTTKRPPGK